MPSNVTITVTEENDKARMRWDYTFGKPGQKGFQHSTKYILLSGADSKMLMHFVGYPEIVYDVPDLAVFTKAGLGTLAATYSYERPNYWHIKKSASQKVVFPLDSNTLTYIWYTTIDGKAKLYSDFEFVRVP